MTTELPQDIDLGNPENALKEVNLKLLRRTEALQRLTKKGCVILQSLGREFEENRRKLCEAGGDECAFLDCETMVHQLIRYESMNPRIREGDKTLEQLIEERRLQKALVIFKQVFSEQA